MVGSQALQEACDRAGVPGPEPHDLDLSWTPDVEAGTALLQQHGVFRQTTEANRQRGTLAVKLGAERIEITSFRNAGSADGGDLRARIHADLAARDMTVGALAHLLADDEVLDPHGGLDDWIAGRVVPVGDPAERIREHPVRWLRYFRRAHQWGFVLDRRIRSVALDPGVLDAVPPEAVAAELRQALAQCPSPGRLLVELHEASLLQRLAPELAPQFDGRPAGPIRHHPEIGQALHMVLALEWIVEHTRHLDERDRNRVAVAVLLHDLGKGTTPADAWPSHIGHEDRGVDLIGALLDRLPGLTDTAGRRLAEAVCSLHGVARALDELRPGTRATLYERYFRDKDFAVGLFALALGADAGGRLGRAAEGLEVAQRTEAAIHAIQRSCATVDAGALFAEHGADRERFRALLHEAWARALAAPRA